MDSRDGANRNVKIMVLTAFLVALFLIRILKLRTLIALCKHNTFPLTNPIEFSYNVHYAFTLYVIIIYRNSETSGCPTRCSMQRVQSPEIKTPDDCTRCMKHRVG